MKKILFTLTMAILFTELHMKLIRTKRSNLKVTHPGPLTESLAESLFSGSSNSPAVKKTLSIMIKQVSEPSKPVGTQAWLDSLEKKVDALRSQMDRRMVDMGIGLSRRHEVMGGNTFAATGHVLSSLLDD